MNAAHPSSATGTTALLAASALVLWAVAGRPAARGQAATPVAPQTIPATATAPPRQGAFNAGKSRPPEDPAQVARGKVLYGLSCQACHGSDLRGGDMGGPNLLRSQVTLSDQHGELITPIIHGARQAQGMPNIGLNDADALAAAAYVRSVISTIKGQGMPPGELKKLNIVTGDTVRGQAYFATHCGTCHSPSGDMQHIAGKYAEPKTLQARWLAGGRGDGPNGVSTKATVSVTTAPAQTVSGKLVHVDDFTVSLLLPDGSEQSFRRTGALPQVIVHDPLEAHRALMSKYTDHDIHDVTAYLVTLK